MRFVTRRLFMYLKLSNCEPVARGRHNFRNVLVNVKSAFRLNQIENSLHPHEQRWKYLRADNMKCPKITIPRKATTTYIEQVLLCQSVGHSGRKFQINVFAEKSWWCMQSLSLPIDIILMWTFKWWQLKQVNMMKANGSGGSAVNDSQRQYIARH